MKILKDKKLLPLLISTSDMMKKCPAFHVEKDDTNAVDQSLWSASPSTGK